MARLLETQLPNAMNEVSPDLYNRMIRILQLNLGSFDPTETPQYTLTTMNQNKFNAGDVIWNLNAKSLQVYDGAKWNEIYSGYLLRIRQWIERNRGCRHAVGQHQWCDIN